MTTGVLPLIIEKLELYIKGDEFEMLEHFSNSLSEGFGRIRTAHLPLVCKRTHARKSAYRLSEKRKWKECRQKLQFSTELTDSLTCHSFLFSLHSNSRHDLGTLQHLVGHIRPQPSISIHVSIGQYTKEMSISESEFIEAIRRLNEIWNSVPDLGGKEWHSIEIVKSVHYVPKTSYISRNSDLVPA